MRPQPDHHHEIETLAAFDQVVVGGPLTGYRVQSVDLTDRTEALLATDATEAVFLGCPMSEEAEAKVRADGALVFPPVPNLPFNPYRGLLYTPDSLFEGLTDGGYEATPDALAYAWFQQTKADGDIFASMLRSVHDDAISDSLDEHVLGSPVVGVMGGHAMARGTDAYAGAARLGRSLARAGLTVATGGGPGAMEAANLGAYAAPLADGMLDEALLILGKAPSFTRPSPTGPPPPSPYGPAGRRAAIRSVSPPGSTGTSPPNAFASHIAKYFANATREDGLLARSTAVWSSCRARPARSMRSSTTTRAPTTTSRAANPHTHGPWWTGPTGRNGSRHGPSSRPLAEERPMEPPASPWSTRSPRPPRRLERLSVPAIPRPDRRTKPVCRAHDRAVIVARMGSLVRL
ncbi:hypothetical protein GCM10018987_20160 [Streptomyces cremeus]